MFLYFSKCGSKKTSKKKGSHFFMVYPLFFLYLVPTTITYFTTKRYKNDELKQWI